MRRRVLGRRFILTIVAASLQVLTDETNVFHSLAIPDISSDAQGQHMQSCRMVYRDRALLYMIRDN
jgi:hypothetical protein